MAEIDIIRGRVETFSRVLQEIPEVRYVGDPILRTPTIHATLEEGIEIGKTLGEVTIKYRKIAGYGRGFAAPQIGINKSVFVTYVGDKLQVFINPLILEKSQTTNFYKELCLSSGILSADVERPEWIVMKWTDEEGKEKQEKVDGILARLYQHEEAHLRGIVNLDESAPGGIEICTFDPLKEQLRTSR